jgi:hypothetical protein
MDVSAPALTPAAEVSAIAERVLGSPTHLVTAATAPGQLASPLGGNRGRTGRQGPLRGTRAVQCHAPFRST